MLSAPESCAPPTRSRSRASSPTSLPTPPTTIRKRARSESNDDERRPEVEHVAHKRQRIWRTPERSNKRPTCNRIAFERAPGPSLPSPPSSDPAPIPATPPRRYGVSAVLQTPPYKQQPMRDTPNNIFLSFHPVIIAEDANPVNLGVTDQRGELPAMMYSFRGKRQIFMNPFYGCMSAPRTKLSPRHPEFTPDELFPPRRLFDPLTEDGDDDDHISFERSDYEDGPDPSKTTNTTSVSQSLVAAFLKVARGRNDDEEFEDGELELDEELEEGVWDDESVLEPAPEGEGEGVDTDEGGTEDDDECQREEDHRGADTAPDSTADTLLPFQSLLQRI
ncbi:unnamed protein product [Peniophora sp. CBMAI 1063]|nr:unnamed protein product [Peniophora sp. CBMAI 1063]